MLRLALPFLCGRNGLVPVATDLLSAPLHLEALGMLELGAAIISIQSSRV
jgi:hypothetical protein